MVTSLSSILDSSAEIALPVNESQVLEVMVIVESDRVIDPPVSTLVRRNVECEIFSALLFPEANIEAPDPSGQDISVKSALLIFTLVSPA